MTYSFHVLVLFGLFLFVFFGLLFSSSSSASVIGGAKNSDSNSQRIALLTANFSVEIPGATGGPEDIQVDNRFAYLVPSLGIHAEEAETIQSIQIDPSGIIMYVVQEGDTLSHIAERFDVSVNTIKWENNMSSNKLSIGQELRILPVTGVRHTIVKGDTFAKIASLYGVDVEDITVFNDIDATKLVPGNRIIIPNGVKKEVAAVSSSRGTGTGSGTSVSVSSSSSSSVNTGYYIKPTAGPMTSQFGPRWGRYHYGVDYGGAVGTPIVAAADGVVSKVGCGSGYGNCLVVKHDNGTESLYAHASALYVGLGAQVSQGQKIAAVGATGNVTGPHLHFEVIDSRTGQKKNMNYLR